MPPTLRAFVAELRRRRVHRVAAVYAAAAFVVLQLADLVVEPLGLPDWTMALLIVLVAAGFVLAVVLGWMFQVGAAGIAREPAAASLDGAPSRAAYVGLGIVLGLVVVGSAGFLATRGDGPARAEGDDIESIAVLPFVSLSTDAADDYFGDGLAEELLNALASIERLRVPARTSSFAFKGQELDVREIGRRLGVEVVLEGSVRRSGNLLRVAAQLVDVATGYTLMSKTYERTVDDVFAVQTELSRSILTAMHLNPDDDDAADGVVRAGTSDQRAHDAYLAGLYHFHRRGANVDSAIASFQQAIALDAGYADAWAGLASAYAVAVFFTSIPSDSAWHAGEAAARRALALDPDHAQAYAALGQLAAVYAWDVEGSIRHYRRSLELAPAVANTRMWLGASLLHQGHLDEALAEMMRARELDPLSAVVAENVGSVLAALGRIDEATAEFDRGVRLNPTMLTVRWARSAMYLRRGRCDEAARLGIEGLPQDELSDALRTIFLAPCDPALLPAARAVTSAWSALYGQPSGPQATVILSLYDAIGDLEDAERWLLLAYDERVPVLINLLPVYLSDDLLARPAVRRVVHDIGMDWVYDARAAAAARAG